MADDKRIGGDEVFAAYAKLHLLPVVGRFAWHQDGQHYACPLVAFYLARRGDDPDAAAKAVFWPDWSERYVIAKLPEFDAAYLSGFMAGVDDVTRGNWYTEPWQRGHEDGLALRKRLRAAFGKAMRSYLREGCWWLYDFTSSSTSTTITISWPTVTASA